MIKTIKKAYEWYVRKTVEAYEFASINAISPYAINQKQKVD